MSRPALLRLLLWGAVLFSPVLAASATAPAARPTRFVASIGGFTGHSFAVELRDGQLHYAKSGPGPGKPVTIKVTPTEAQWQAFRRALDQLDVWAWRKSYEHPGSQDGTGWSLEVDYPDRSVQSGGRNRYPDASARPASDHYPTVTFQRYLAAVRALLGGREFE